MNRTRVLLADDHAATLRSWQALLEPEFDIVGSVADGQALVDAYDRLEPDVIVTDISMPGMDGFAAAETILRRHPGARSCSPPSMPSPPCSAEASRQVRLATSSS
jgi:CheY-like chemotaxis protein